MSKTVRPTKKQTELLSFIKGFIEEHGYSPSYREIMRGCGYNSVATVAVHIDNLITRGHLVKRENSARSLELSNNVDVDLVGGIKQSSFIQKVEKRFKTVESAAKPSKKSIDELYVLTGAAKVLGYSEAENFKTRLINLKKHS